MKKKVLALAMVMMLSITSVACGEPELGVEGQSGDKVNVEGMTINATQLSDREDLINMNSEYLCSNIWDYSVDDTISKMTIYAYSLKQDKWEKKKLVTLDESNGFLKTSSMAIGFSEDYSKMSFAVNDEGGAGGNVYETGAVLTGNMVGGQSPTQNTETIEKDKMIPMYFQYKEYSDEKRNKAANKFREENTIEQMLEKPEETGKVFEGSMIIVAVFE